MAADNPAGRPPSGPSRRAARAVGLAAALFGLATVGAGSLVLFGPPAARSAAGRVVPAVLWTNFGLGFAYVAAGIGVARRSRWASPLAAAIAAATALAGLAFAAHALAGGAFEARTPAALALRAAFWAGVALWTRKPAPPPGPGAS